MCNKLEINQKDFFEKDFYYLTLDELDRVYDKFILKIIEEENKKHVLSLQEKDAIKAYYSNVLIKKKKEEYQ